MILIFLFLFLKWSHETGVPVRRDIAGINRQSPIVYHIKLDPYLDGNRQRNFLQTNAQKQVSRNHPLFHDYGLQSRQISNQHQLPFKTFRLKVNPLTQQYTNWQPIQLRYENQLPSPQVQNLQQFKTFYSKPLQQSNIPIVRNEEILHRDQVQLKTFSLLPTNANIPLKSQSIHRYHPLEIIGFQVNKAEPLHKWNFANLLQKNSPNNDLNSHHRPNHPPLVHLDHQETDQLKSFDYASNSPQPMKIRQSSRTSKPFKLSTIPVKAEGRKHKNKKARNKPKKLPQVEHFESNHFNDDKSNFPTKPIYPGEGIWAKAGPKRHLITLKNEPRKLDDGDESPGHEIFVDVKKKLNGLENKLRLEKKSQQQKSNVEEEPGDEDEDPPSDTFVPYRSYAQVRKTSSEEHLPAPKEEESLKESIKDSRTHVVYSEEGYEDSGYDHADEEKNAESTEGYSNVDDETEVEYQNVNGSESKIEHEFPEIPQSPSLSDVNYEELHKDVNDENFREEALPVDDESKNSNEQHIKVSTNNNPEIETIDLGSELVENKHGELVQNEDLTSEDQTHGTPNSKKKQKQEIVPQEDHTIDNVQDETKFGTRIQLKRQKRSPNVDAKYPYYESKKLDENSPLRYAENLQDIPDKRNDPMAFYNKADKIECPEMADLEPIPEHIKNEENRTEAGDDDQGAEKLGKLGDKIDCLKAKYFGEDPFDSPLFREKIEPPGDIFKSFDGDVEDYDETTTSIDETEGDRASKSLDKDDATGDEELPEASPYIMLQRRRLKRPPQKRPKYKYHSRYVSRKQPQQLIDYTKPTERISEVHYKDEIKPNEQMNVFADIINNIKNSTLDMEAATSNNNPVAVKPYRSTRRTPSRYKPKKPSRSTTRSPRGREEDIIKQFYLTSTHKPFYPTPVNDFVPNDGGFIPMRNPQDDDFLKTDYNNQNAHTFNSQKTRKRTRRPQHESPRQSFEETKQRKPSQVNQIEETQLKKGIVEEPVTLGSDVHQNHRAVYHDLDVETSNTYDVIGMRPPPEKPTYTHQMSYHPVRRRAAHPIRRRVVRRSTRRGYSEIRRENKQLSDENAEVEEEEEYVPHRNRNFHYDEVKKKIVYDNEEDKDDSSEYDDAEIEEPTTKATKVENKRIMFAPKPPEGPSYIDFVKLLKSNPNYVEIPDPTTPKIEDATTAPVTSTTSKPTEPPEFLNILAKVRSNENYKTIEDRKSKTKTTTEAAIEEESDDFENVQNSSGGQRIFAPSSDVDDGNESEVKRYNPRTSINTSKYTSIERTPATRHNMSHFEDEAVLESGTISETLTRPHSNDVDTTIQNLPTETPTSANPKTEQTDTTTSKRIVSRGRGRFTTMRPTTTELTRRSRTRVRSRVTTEEPSEQTRNRRNLQRKSEDNLTVPRNHKARYTPINSNSPIMALPAARAITANLLQHTNVTDEKPPTKDVDLLKKFDARLKHGGNYRYKKVEISISRHNTAPTAYEIEDSEEIKRLSDVVPKHFAFYSDPKLPSHINRLKNSRSADVSEEEPDELGESGEKEEEDHHDDIYDDVIRNAKPEVTTKKSRFIKDPSKRLYFYAPV